MLVEHKVDVLVREVIQRDVVLEAPTQDMAFESAIGLGRFVDQRPAGIAQNAP